MYALGIVKEPQIEVFGASDMLYGTMKKMLQSPEAKTMTHTELESQLQESGTALLRQLVQDHLALRGRQEREQGWTDLKGADGQLRPHQRTTTRQLMTIFGEVTVERQAYGGREMESLRPLDAALNLPEESYSLGVRKRVAIEVSRGSYDEAVEAIQHTTGATIAKRQVEELAQRAAQDFDEFYAERRREADRKHAAEEARRSERRGPQASDIVVLTADAKGIVMRKEDLRQATRKAGETQVRELKHRLKQGEKRGRKRMAEVASVYEIAPFVRTAEDIVREFRSPEIPLPVRPKPENKRVWAHIDRDAAEVIGELYEDAERRDPTRAKRWVALVDGHRGQIDAMEREAKERGISLTLIVDVVHVLGYLWEAAAAIEGAGRPETEKWVTDRLYALLGGAHPGHVAAGIRRSATIRKLRGNRRKMVDTCADYLQNQAAYLQYATYLAQGFPIATGVIEGACRHLVKDRMGRTGARWRISGAEAVLRLRALRASGDFEAYWQFHEKQELDRNHASNYAGALPKLNESPPPRRLRLVK